MQESGQSIQSQNGQKIGQPIAINQASKEEQKQKGSSGQGNNKDFQKAYNQLQKDIIKQEVSGSLADSKQKHLVSGQQLEDYMKNKDSASSVQEKNQKAYERLYKEHETLIKKREELHIQSANKEEEELKECTFQPRLKTQQAGKRSKEQFLQSQQKFLEGKHEKIKQQQEKLLEEELGVGASKKKSTLNKQEWIDRFTKKKDDKVSESSPSNKQNKKKPYQDPNTTFKPQLNKKTEKLLAKKGERSNAFDELVKDSQKRKARDQLTQTVKVPSANVKAQEHSMKILFQKFEKDFEQAYQKIIRGEGEAEGEHQQEDQGQLSSEQFIELLVVLGFIESHIEVELNLANQLINIIASNMNKKNCLVLLCQIEKIYLQWMCGVVGINKQDEGQQQQSKETNSLGKINEDGIYIVTQNESLRISKRFESLKLKRSRFLTSTYKKKVNSEEQMTEFRPTLDKNSQKILEKKKQTQQNPQLKKDKALELIERGKQYKEKREQLTKQKKEQEGRESFKPTLISKYDSAALTERMSPERRRPDQIFEELYKIKQKKDDISTYDKEYEKNKQECIFKPNAKNQRVSIQQSSPKATAKRTSKASPIRENSQRRVVIRGKSKVEESKTSKVEVKVERQLEKKVIKHHEEVEEHSREHSENHSEYHSEQQEEQHSEHNSEHYSEHQEEQQEEQQEDS